MTTTAPSAPPPGRASTARVTRLDPAAAIEPFTPWSPGEVALATAIAARRDAAAHRVARDLGVDLRALVEDPRAQRVVDGRADLEAWDALDLLGAVREVLDRHDVAHQALGADRSRLVWTRDGVDANAVATGPVAVASPARYSPARANAVALEGELLEGASYVVKAIDEHVRRASDLIEDVETVLGARSSALAYLGGPGSRGWGPHYDNHAVLVIQVAGTKRWEVHEPIEPRPLRPHSPYRTSGRIVWRRTLEPGDVVFVPRGWGHEVVGSDSSSLHVTIPLRVRTGAQLLEMVAAQAHEVDELRADLPVGAVGRATALGRLLGPGTVERGLAAWRARLPSRARPALSTLDDVLADLDAGRWPSDVLLRLSAPGGVQRSGSALAMAGRRLDLDDPELSTLAELVGGARSADLAAVHADPTLGADLLRAGMLHVEPATVAATGPVAPSTPWPRPRPPSRPRRGTVVQVGGSPFPTPGARQLDPTDPWEAELLAANEAGRRRAITELADRFEDLDLPALLDRTREPRPVRARLTPAGLHELDGLAIVDQLLSCHDLGGDALKLARDHDPRNRPAPPALFVAPYSTYSPTLIDVAAVRDLLRDATTLIALGIDDRVPALSRWVARLERATGRRSSINAYLSHGEAPGFGAHWDDHDVLVLQVAGAKRWSVREPIEPRTMRPHSPTAVTDREVWAGTVRPGDALYLPRGWGHAVGSDGGRSLHFTFPLRAMHAAAIAEHAAGAAVASPAARGDVALLGRPPLILPTAGGTATAEAIAFWRARVPARAHQPLGGLEALRAGAPGTTVRLAAATGWFGRRGDPDQAPTDLRWLVAADRTLAVDPELGPLLGVLATTEALPLEVATATIPEALARCALEDLARAGLVEVGVPQRARIPK